MHPDLIHDLVVVADGFKDHGKSFRELGEKDLSDFGMVVDPGYLNR